MTYPTPPDGWVPPSLTDGSGVHRTQVVVARVLPDFEILGELLQANVADGRWEDDQGRAGCTISCPSDDPSLRLIYDADGTSHLIDREFVVLVDGMAVGWYKATQPAKWGKGQVVFDCVGLLDAYVPGRTLGAVPYDYLEGAGDFTDESMVGDFLGDGYEVLDLPTNFTWTGDADDIRWVAGPRSSYALAIRGDAFGAEDRLRIQLPVELATTTTFNNIFRSSAFMRLPDFDADLDGQLLMTMERFDFGEAARQWPRAGEAFPDGYIGVIDETRLTGDWDVNPVTAAALAKRGPYDSVFRVDIYPVSSTGWLFVDEVRIFRRDTLGTGAPVDLTDHLVLLFEDAQGDHKSSWNLPIERGTDTGVEEVGVWRRDDWQPLSDALAALYSRDDGPAVPWVDYQRRIRCTATRGVDRTTMTVGPDDIVIDEGWTEDEGARASQVISSTDYGDSYYRHISIATDTSRTDGHLIEVLMRGPNGMGLRQLDQVTKRELAIRAQPQKTRRVWLSADDKKAWVISPCDSFRLFSEEGFVPFDHRVTLVRREFHPQRGLVALDVGVDEAA